jgi:hypothetical protein
MAKVERSAPVPVEQISRSILILRGQRVILDSDLAAIYGVSTGRLNEAVKRNIERFPQDFMLRLSNAEYAALISQIATSKTGFDFLISLANFHAHCGSPLQDFRSAQICALVFGGTYPYDLLHIDGLNIQMLSSSPSGSMRLIGFPDAYCGHRDHGFQRIMNADSSGT